MPSVRVDVKPELLAWACERTGSRSAELRESVPHLNEWLAGKRQPTLRQLEDFARKACVALGYLFLPNPPDERVPIPDLRTVAGQGVKRPSPELLDVIGLCERRQGWYREYAQKIGEESLPFFGTATLATPPAEVAAEMQRVLEFDVAHRQEARSIEDALRIFIEKTEAAGILVMASGVFGTNTHRKLDPEEFRGFVLADPLAPLIFINGADAKAAQMFTLAHELAHLWLGTSALTGETLVPVLSDKAEQWCNKVAAEFLVPLDALRAMSQASEPLANLKVFSSRFKVSALVILRRLLDAGLIDRKQFDSVFVAMRNMAPHPKPEAKKGGGDFYNSFPRAASRRFIRALYADTAEGNTLYRDALQLLCISRVETLRELAKKAGGSQ